MSPITANGYFGFPEPGKIPVLAIVFSAALHLALLTAFNLPHVGIKALPQVRPDPWVPVIPAAADEDPPIEQPKDLDKQPETPAIAAPTLPDPPVVSLDRKEFTQDPEALQPAGPPDSGLVTIPINARHGPASPEGGPVFALGDLDKAPQPVSRTAPVFPVDQLRAVSTATVLLGFIVDRSGHVAGAHVISSSHQGFEQAALSAVVKWKFRPGIRNGRTVSTRVEQPLEFTLQEGT